jgi:hypothetical protein
MVKIILFLFLIAGYNIKAIPQDPHEDQKSLDSKICSRSCERAKYICFQQCNYSFEYKSCRINCNRKLNRCEKNCD